MEFRILGTFEVVGATGSINLRGAKRRALLACLLVNAGHAMSSDRLVDELWGDDGSDGAVRTVQTYVSQLRKLLRGEAVELETRPTGYMLQVDPEDVDASRFERAARTASAQQDPAQRLAMLDDALGLWRGPPLGEFTDAGWATRAATRLEALHVQALQRRYDALLELDRAGDDVAGLEDLVSSHPLDEKFAAQLMLAFYRSGRQADALATYQQTRRRLVDELGIEPSAELADLEHRILEHDPTLASAHRPSADHGNGETSSTATDGRSPPSGTVTFLFTDQQQSSSLWDADPEAMDRAAIRHDAMMRSIIARWHGWVFSTGGDGFGAAFASHADAIRAAIEAQTALRDEPWPKGFALRVRMGLHTGAASERDGNYFGPPVNRAARIMGAAHGGQVLVSQVTRGLVDDQRLGLRFVDIGRHRLRGLNAPERLYHLVIDDDDTAYPPPRTVGAADELPVPRSSLHGREDDVGAVAALLTTAPVVTLVGVGGVGKTRLAVEVARRVADRFDTAVLIDLAPIEDPDSVVGATAAALRIPHGTKSTTVATIARSLRARDALVVFDNCEHVLAPVSDLLDEVAAATTTCRFVATSREPLGVDGEQLWPVQPLHDAAAAELFVARARALRPDYVLGAADRCALPELCRQLDGLPLALELAAARTGHLSVSELLENLDQRFELLTSSRRRTHHRSRSLEATMEWSYQLLDPEEQRVLRASAVFPGGLTVEALAGVTRTDPSEVRTTVGSLVAKSLVAVDTWDTDRTRYRLLETVREYARERLVDADEAETVVDRFAAWFCDRLAAEVVLIADLATEGHRFCVTEIENLLAALDRVHDKGDLVRVGRTVSLLIVGLPTYRWIDIARPFVNRADIEQALEGDDLALYLMAGAWTENAAGRYRDQLVLAERALAAATPGGPVFGAAAYLVINALAIFAPDRGVALANDLLARAGDLPVAVRRDLLAGKADCAVSAGRNDEGLELYAEAYGPLENWPVDLAILLIIDGRVDDAKEILSDEVSDDEFYRYNLELGRAVIAAFDGRHEEASEHLRMSARLARRHPADLLDRDLLVVAAAIAFMRRGPRRASVLLAIERDTLWLRSPHTFALYLHIRDRVRQEITREQAAECKAEAAALTVNDALAQELGDAWPLEP